MTTPTTTPEVDDFAAAFAELNLPGDKSTPPADPPVETPPADTPPADTPPADPPVETPPADTPPADTPPADPPVETLAPVVETEEQMRARIRAELEAELKRAEPPAPAPAPATPPATPPAAKIYTEEEDQLLEKYKNDWPDIAKAEQLARRADSYRVVEHIFAQLRPILSSLQESVGAHSKRSMYDDIVDLVPDYDEVRDKTLAWIDTQPDYLKAAYQQVANEGTPDQVADLINRYKRETGQSTVAPAPVVKPAAAPAAPVAPAVAKAAAALKPVATTRSEPKADAADKNDFESAFAEFSKL
jgi:hypothetical protein